MRSTKTLVVTFSTLLIIALDSCARPIPSCIRRSACGGINQSNSFCPKREVSQLQTLQPSSNCYGKTVLTASVCIGDSVEREELKLYQLVNEYRSQYGLPAIPLSKSLVLVANRHALDLHENVGFLTHSWSDCSYDADNSSSYSCIWEAPKRLGTTYPSYGYENAHGASGGYIATANQALNGWKNSKYHNDVILNQGAWQNTTFNALGVGIHEGYAVLWFGVQVDPAGNY